MTFVSHDDTKRAFNGHTYHFLTKETCIRALNRELALCRNTPDEYAAMQGRFLFAMMQYEDKK